TETVYGLGANALDEDAVRRVFAAKRRPSFNPLIVHVDDVARVDQVAREVPALARALADAFWPGPLTLVLPRRDAVPDVVTGGLDTVGVRVPRHPVARALIAAAGVPLAAPSANPFTKVSPTTAEHVLAELGGCIHAVVDAGPTEVGIESTVVAIEVDDDGVERVVVLRHGGISQQELERRGFAVVEARDDDRGEVVRRSPGRVERHYAPGVPLVAVDRGDDGALQLPASDGASDGASDSSCAVLCRGDARGADRAALREVLPADAAGFARGLYAALHRIGGSGCAVAFVERLPVGDAWTAVADRLRRAGLAD
ncbi:MAG: threonylcarbamoyl-AMP synthase, partial [Planctomycetes bacterium]|nr:threonylcarbamoyl-AMP synthase [Planctomycetota bacterium]